MDGGSSFISSLPWRRLYCKKQNLYYLGAICILLYIYLYEVIEFDSSYKINKMTAQYTEYLRSYHPGNLASSFTDYFQIDDEEEFPEEEIPHHDNLTDWQKIIFGRKNFFLIYSAYVEYSLDSNSTTNPQTVTILTSPTRTLEEFHEGNFSIRCVFRWRDIDSLNTTTKVSVTQVESAERMGNWNKHYAGMLFRCPLPRYRIYTTKPPYWVTLILFRANRKKQQKIDNDFTDNLIPIQYRRVAAGYKPEEKNIPYRYTFAVCVLPMYNFNKVIHFLEWFEYYTLMGVEKFTFYNLSIGPATSCIMNHMSDYHKGKVKLNVLPWHNYPLKEHIHVRDGPSLPEATYDCLYRNKHGLSKYITIVDIDEFITPNNTFDGGIETFHDMLDKIHKNRQLDNSSIDLIGAYMFRNSFYNLNFIKNKNVTENCLEYVNSLGMTTSSIEFVVCLNAITTQFDKRNQIMEHNHRSKYFVRPEAALHVGNHEVSVREDDGYKKLHVNEGEAFLRHYRYWDKGWSTLRTDITVHPFNERIMPKLLTKVAESVTHFMQICNFNISNVLS